jgi:hypothetical protein
MFFHTGTCWVRGGLPVGGVSQEDQEPGRSPLPLPPQGRVQACFQGHSFTYFVQCFGSGSGLDPDSIRSADPDPRRVKIDHKSRKKLRNFMF